MFVPQFLAPDPAGEADIPGAADSRLAGWRVASPVPDNNSSPDVADGADTSNIDSTNGDESGEPACGDVVEVRFARARMWLLLSY